MDLWQYDATDLARRIRTGQASAREAVDSVLARLHKVNPAINAVVRVLEDEARAQAETADAARARGHALPPLHGVPVTTKINVDQAGLPTDNGVIPLKDFIANEDSPVVANLKHAGAIIVARVAARAPRSPPELARSRMATTSAARCASRPTAMASSACAPASPAFPRSTPARPRPGAPSARS